MRPSFKTGISILVGKPSVSMDSNRSSFKQPSVSSSDHVIHPSSSHSALSDPFKTRNFALGLKTDNVTHWRHLKTNLLLYSTEKGDFPVLRCWCMQRVFALMCDEGLSHFLLELLTSHTSESYLTSCHSSALQQPSCSHVSSLFRLLAFLLPSLP